MPKSYVVWLNPDQHLRGSFGGSHIARHERVNSPPTQSGPSLNNVVAATPEKAAKLVGIGLIGVFLIQIFLLALQQPGRA